MKTLFALVSAMLMSIGTPAFSQNNWGWIARDVATASIYTAGNIRINDRQAQSQDKRTDADVKINDRQMESEDRRTVSNERIARDQISAQVEMDRNRTAAEVYRTAAETGRSGDVSMKNGQVSARLDPHDRPLPRERRDNNGYGGPRVR
jgi:hypothetical protein